MDVIFYFVMSLLIATVLCYLIFLIKDNLLRQDIAKTDVALQTVGTDQQKKEEGEVINYRNKINDFSSLLRNHEFASNAFAFLQTQTMPNVWFNQFSLDEKNNDVQLSGEADSMDAFSRQVATFEVNKYIKKVGSINSSLGKSARTAFAIDLSLDQNIFSYLSNQPATTDIITPSGQLPAQQGQTTTSGTGTTQTTTTGTTQTATAGSGSTTASSGGSATSGQQTPAGVPSNENLITSFHFLLTPEVVGVVDETNYIITLTVPQGTDVKNLISSIVTSPMATVSPNSGVSQSFTSPVTYRVTAQNGAVQSYIVKVVVATPPAPVKKANSAGSVILIIVILIVIIIAAGGVFWFVWKNKKQTNN